MSIGTKPTLAGDRSTSQNAGWKLYLAGFLGGLMLAIGDLLTNDTSATVLKLQAILQRHHLIPGIDNGGLVGLILIGVLGAVFCWIWPVPSKGDAFARGFSVFAVLAVGTPYKITQGQMPPTREAPARGAQQSTNMLPSLISSAIAAPNETPREPKILAPVDRAVLATVTVDYPGVSSCKPHYWGLFGLGSLVNNSLEVCSTGHILKAGAKVNIRNCWDTGFRGYRYAEIEYEWNGERVMGWVMTGQTPKYWSYIVPDAPSFNFLPRSCAR